MLASCFGEPTGPRSFRRAEFAFTPVFSSRAASLVPFDRVRVRLAHQTGGGLVVDSLIAFPSDADSVALSLSVPIEGTSETLVLTLAMIDAAGDTVFRGGPVPLTALPGILVRSPTEVPIVYTGVGSNAATVRFTGTPVTAVYFGDTVTYTAEALDSAGRPIAGTPIAFRVDPRDTALARVPDEAVGRVIARSVRGQARVIAELLTRQADTTALAVQPLPSALAAAGGSQTGTVGAALGQPITAVVRAADGLGVQGVAVAFAVTAGGGTLSAASAVTDSAGRASVTWTLGTTAGTQSAAATVAGLSPATVAFGATALAGPAQTLAFTQAPPASTTAVDTFGVAVAARDAFGNTATGFTGPVTLALGTNPSGATLLGITTRPATAGVATFVVRLSAAASGYTIVASASGLPSVTSAAINVTAGAAAQLTWMSQPASGVAGAVLTPHPVIALRDAAGNVVPTATDTVAMRIAVGPAGATLLGTQTVTAVAGQATFADLVLPKAGGYVLTPVSGSMAHDSTPYFTVAPAAASALAFTQQPANVTAGAVLTPAVQVTVRDSLGNVVTGYADTVALALAANPGGDSLTGTVRAAATAGVATFAGLTLRHAAAGYALRASAAGVAGTATSAAFDVAPAAAADLALVSGGGQSGVLGTVLPAPVVVKVADAYGNGVAGHVVAFAVASGGGSVGAALDTTDASGLASTTWTLGPTPGTQSLTATATGLAGSPLTVTATTSGAASTTVSPHLDTLTSLGQTVQLAAQAKDPAGQPVSGTFVWASRTPAAATVSASGLVTAVADGATWVVATEAGGTKDSAQIVVQQRVASVSVSPAARGIYLTRTYRFTATAVDGLGHPMAAATPFTWASTAPAVASVDTAGLVTGVGLGAAQVRATTGAITGVANVTILTPITRIVVAVDTVGASTPDTFTLPSLGLTRRYRAIAHDTLDAVMGGVAFTWASTNGSVAPLTGFAGDTAGVVSAANGVTQVRAGAQGVTSSPAAQLTVAQVLASIELKPDSANPTATVAVAGTMHVSARGRDANGRYIAGGSFTYHSATPSVAVVDSATGLVTGVANGTADLTATSGAITSNVVTVTVGGAVPALISFGRDTLSVGRGNSGSVPILLSKPAGASLTVNLTATAFAHWSPASVVIPQGQTSASATLVGDSAGTTTVTASDGSGLGYSTATAIAKVTANLRLASGGYAINANDVVGTQVLLSDPSPAGGTYVTFSYGTAGVAAASPDPAFIPQGQLAADVQIRGLAGGTTTITPVAIGVNGAASSFTAYAPVLRFNSSGITLGQGQYESGLYVYLPTTSNVAVPLTLASSDTTVATVPATLTIPGGSNYAYFTASAVGVGSATLSVAASGWTAAGTVSVRATTPAVGLSGGGSLYTTSPATSVTVYAEDSLRYGHYRTNALVVRLASSDTTVMKVLDTVVTIAAGSYYTSARVAPAGLGGTAWIHATAGGHFGDSTQYTVQGPPLHFSWGTALVGAGQKNTGLYVYTPNSVTAPLVVTLANTDTTVLGVPATVTIPTGTNYVYFDVLGLTPGAVTLTASAPGFEPTTASYVVSTPRVVLSGGSTINDFAPPRTYAVYATDSLGYAHPRTAALAVSLASSDTAVVRTDTAATIPAGAYYASTPVLTPVGIGSARVRATAAGHGADSTTYTVVQPKLNVSFYSAVIGRRQYFGPNAFYVYTPDSRPVRVPVTLTQLHGAVDSLTTTAPVIDSASNYAYFSLYGMTAGVDTIIAAASGYAPDTAFVTVTTPRLVASGLPGTTTTTNPPIGHTIYATDSLGYGHTALDTVVVAAVSSDTTVLRPAQPFIRIPAGAYYVSATVNVVGPGTASITYSDSAGTGYLPATTNTVTVTGPSLALANGSSMLGMRQRGGVNSSYVYTPNAVATPLVVHLLSTSPRVATVPDSVVVAAGSNYAYFEVTALDTVGTIQIQATALGYSPAAMNVQVTVPKFVLSTSGQLNTTSPPAGITVYATDANGYTHYTTEAVTVTLASSAPTVAAVDSTTVTIPAGGYYANTARWSPGVVGTAQLSATDARAALYAYAPATANVAVVNPNLYFSWGTQALGVGQYVDNEYVYTSDNAASPTTVALGHTGTARISTLVGGVPVSSVTVPTGSNYVYFRTLGTSSGTDTLVASATAPLHNPATAYTIVGPGRVDPLGGWPGTLKAGDSVLVTLYARDPSQGTRYVAAATTFTLAPNASVQFVSGGTGSAPITSATIPADRYYVQFYLKGVSAGTGFADVTAADYQPYTTPAVTITP